MGESLTPVFRSSLPTRATGSRPARSYATAPAGTVSPWGLFVFESHDSEAAFLDIADEVHESPIVAANAATLAEHDVMGEA